MREIYLIMYCSGQANKLELFDNLRVGQPLP